MPKTVSNSSILIHLGKIGLIDLLREQFGEIWIPEAVWKEVVLEGADKEDAKIISKANWIHVKKVKNSPLLKSLLTGCWRSRSYCSCHRNQS